MKWGEVTRRDQLEGRTISRVNLQRITEPGRGRFTHVASIDFADGARLVLEVGELESTYAVTGRIYPTPSGLDTRAAAESPAHGRPLRDSAPFRDTEEP